MILDCVDVAYEKGGVDASADSNGLKLGYYYWCGFRTALISAKAEYSEELESKMRSSLKPLTSDRHQLLLDHIEKVNVKGGMEL